MKSLEREFHLMWNEIAQLSPPEQSHLINTLLSRNVNTRRFGRLYKSYGGGVLDPCVYCGAISHTLDHVPSLSLAEALLQFQDRFLLVPACYECNDALANFRELSITARKSYILERYRRKYSHLHKSRYSYTVLRALQERFDLLDK